LGSTTCSYSSSSSGNSTARNTPAAVGMMTLYATSTGGVSAVE
jgi:hypothetical protein